MIKKAITTEQLAGMIKKGFDDITGRMAKKTDMEHGFQETSKRLDVVDGRLLHLEASMTTLQHDVAEIRKHFVYHDEFEDALARIFAIEKKLGIKSPR